MDMSIGNIIGKVLSFGSYEASLIKGSSNNLIVAMQSMNPEDRSSLRFEWANSLGKVSAEANIVYIADVENSWYTSRNGFTELCEFVSRIREALEIDWAASFGLSMGGYGAIRFGGAIHVDRAIGFCAQTSIKTRAVFDGRYHKYWERLDDDDLAGSPLPAETILCTTCDGVGDVLHASQFFPDNPNVHRFIFQGDHFFSHMYENGQICDVLAWLLLGGKAEDTPHGARLQQSIVDLAAAIVSGKGEDGFNRYLRGEERDDRFLPIDFRDRIIS